MDVLGLTKVTGRLTTSEAIVITLILSIDMVRRVYDRSRSHPRLGRSLGLFTIVSSFQHLKTAVERDVFSFA